MFSRIGPQGGKSRPFSKTGTTGDHEKKRVLPRGRKKKVRAGGREWSCGAKPASRSISKEKKGDEKETVVGGERAHAYSKALKAEATL